MSIDKANQKFNMSYLSQSNCCNCQGGYNNQASYSPFGIFDGTFSGVQSPVNTQFSAFGGWSGFSGMFGDVFGGFNPLMFNWFSNFSMPSFSMPTFVMPTLPILPTFTPSFSSVTGTGKSKSGTGNYNLKPLSSATKEEVLANMSKNDTQFKDILAKQGVEYDSEVGHAVTKYAIDKAKASSTEECAASVSTAYREAAFDIGRGHAYQKKEAIVGVNKDGDKFTEIKLQNKEQLRQLPAGTVVVYGKGACKYSSDYGHVFIATGEGRGVSDFLEQNPRFDVNADVTIYVPTKKVTA